MTTDTASRAYVIAAVRSLQEDRDRALALLADVSEGHTHTSRADLALVQLAAGTFDEIRRTVEAAITRCDRCGEPMYRGTECGDCAFEAVAATQS
jgi:hypothetical protein